MKQILLVFLVVFGGMTISVQVATNKRLENAVRSPALAMVISFAIGCLTLGALAATGWVGRGSVSGVTSAPWWSWAGGALSAFAIVSIIALPHLGVAAVVAATVFGQLTAAVVLDHFGWLGVPQVRLNFWRISGAVLLLAGTWMMQRK